MGKSETIRFFFFYKKDLDWKKSRQKIKRNFGVFSGMPKMATVYE
jgi:hypothetical protein